MSENKSQQSIGAAEMFGAFASPTSNTEATPEMRSVAISRTPALILPPNGSGLSKPPPLGFARPAPLSTRGPSKSDSLKVKQTWTGVTAPCAWDISSDDLELVPMDFPLERTHRTIEGADASEVARRISVALRDHSIEAKFAKNPVKVKCKTNNLVSFRIRLYAGGESGLPVIVEVQRRSGSASCFMKSCRAILAAAEGKLVPEECNKRVPPPMQSIGQLKCVQAAALPPLCVARASDEEMARAVSMIRSGQKDSISLGLENLLSLTDPIHTLPGIAAAVSKCIILGDDKYEIREDIRAFIERDVFDNESKDEEAVRSHTDRVRFLALAVFANALSICSHDGCLKNAIEEQAWFKEHFMSPLVDELKFCDSSACSSIQASRCISSLLESSISARNYLTSCGLVQALEDALAYGKASNDLLAKESGRCFDLLNA